MFYRLGICDWVPNKLYQTLFYLINFSTYELYLISLNIYGWLSFYLQSIFLITLKHKTALEEKYALSRSQSCYRSSNKKRYFSFTQNSKIFGIMWDSKYEGREKRLRKKGLRENFFFESAVENKEGKRYDSMTRHLCDLCNTFAASIQLWQPLSGRQLYLSRISYFSSFNRLEFYAVLIITATK